MRRFENAILHRPQHTTTITLRYVGQITGEQDPWARSKRTIRHGSLLGMFLHSFRSLFPDTPLETNVFEISDTRFAAFSSEHTRSDTVFEHITNQMERTFINLFGPNTLFNLQMGGTLSDHGIDSVCEDVFAKCHTNLPAWEISPPTV